MLEVLVDSAPPILRCVLFLA